VSTEPLARIEVPFMLTVVVFRRDRMSTRTLRKNNLEMSPHRIPISQILDSAKPQAKRTLAGREGMFDSGPVFPMPLSIAVPAFAKWALHRRAVVAVELAVAIPGLGTLSRPLSGRAILAMILAFFVAPFDRSVWPDRHDGSGFAVVLHK
jgi:hypothetical protein